jgi:hypothetical protein
MRDRKTIEDEANRKVITNAYLLIIELLLDIREQNERRREV